MFPPSHDGGDNLVTMFKMIQKKKNQKTKSQSMVRSENSLFSKTSWVLKGY